MILSGLVVAKVKMAKMTIQNAILWNVMRCYEYHAGTINSNIEIFQCMLWHHNDTINSST